MWLLSSLFQFFFQFFFIFIFGYTGSRFRSVRFWTAEGVGDVVLPTHLSHRPHFSHRLLRQPCTPDPNNSAIFYYRRFVVVSRGVHRVRPKFGSRFYFFFFLPPKSVRRPRVRVTLFLDVVCRAPTLRCWPWVRRRTAVRT